MSHFVVLMAEDSQHDIVATQRAWKAHGIQNPLHVVNDGEECLDYLHQRGRFAGSGLPRPGLIILDLRMPKMDGLEVLRHVRADPQLARIPVIILTTSKAERDRQESYASGASAYVIKPIGFQEYVEVVRRINEYWEIVEMPG